MKIFDISYGISPKLHGFPDDPQTKFNTVCDIKDNCPVRVTEIICSSHVGTHADAPGHFIKNGKTIDQLDLAIFYGPCIVVDIQKENSKKYITSDDLKNLSLKPRVLFKTGSNDLNKEFSKDFYYIDPECLHYLANQKVCLIGIDTPSVDSIDSKDLLAHHACFKEGITLLENLNLANVIPGFYTLVAFPLKFEGLDASPVRAVLIKEDI